MVKNWNQFNESKAEKPGPNVPGSVKVNLSDEDVNAFSDESSLSKLIQDDKVALLGNEAWYWEGDNQTKAVLDQYLEIAGKNELDAVVESVVIDKDKVDYAVNEISTVIKNNCACSEAKAEKAAKRIVSFFRREKFQFK